MDNMFIADMHCDTVLRMGQGADISQRSESGHADLIRLREGGVGIQVFACFIDRSIPPGLRVAHVDRMIDRLHRMADDHADLVGLAFDADGARAIVESGRIAAVIGIENGLAIDNSLDNLRHFHDRGVRIMTLTHNFSHEWCLSSGDREPAFAGLTAFGEDVVRAMNDLGMIVDVSHVAPSSVEAVLAVSDKPVVASHSDAHALCAHHRNLTDEQILAIARTGGLIGVNFCGDFLSPDWKRLSESYAYTDEHIGVFQEYDRIFTSECSRAEYEERMAKIRPFLTEYERRVRRSRVNVATVADHIDYIVNLAGPDHVGLGADYDGITFAPEGLEDCSKLPGLVTELKARGYTAEELTKILHGNFLRVFRAVSGS